MKFCLIKTEALHSVLFSVGTWWGEHEAGELSLTASYWVQRLFLVLVWEELHTAPVAKPGHPDAGLEIPWNAATSTTTLSGLLTQKRSKNQQPGCDTR